MKCIHCGADSKWRERKDGGCPRCRHPFAFEPGRDPYRVTDTQFQKAVERVSGGGKVQFTQRHLWYEFNRRWMKPRFWRSPWGAMPFVGASPGLLAAVGLIKAAVFPLAALGVAAGVGIGAAASSTANKRAPGPPRPPRIPTDIFEWKYLRRWREVHGDARLPGLLPARESARPSAPREVPPDVAVFSFDRAVVTDRWETAQMLVANRFHFEHNCAVLSRDGYPDGIGDTVKEMLRRNPRLTVFALHDASSSGCLLPLTLREWEWFPDPAVRIVDLGLRPGTVRRLRIPALALAPRAVTPRLRQVLPPEDVAWLRRGHVGELAALRPAQVLRAAYRGIVGTGAGDGASSSGSDGGEGFSDGGGVIWVGDTGGGADTAAVDGFG